MSPSSGLPSGLTDMSMSTSELHRTTCRSLLLASTERCGTLFGISDVSVNLRFSHFVIFWQTLGVIMGGFALLKKKKKIR